MRSITGVDYAGQRVLVRMDFNVELNNVAEVQEHFKIDVGKPTIDHLLAFPGVKVAMVSHFGRPAGKPDPRYSLARMVPHIERAFGRQVLFVPDCVGASVAAALETLPDGVLLLLENTRFHPEEEANDPGFSERMAQPFTAFVNEAFSASHRAHASIVGVTVFLPSVAGFRVEKEVAALDRVRLDPRRPAIAVIGGDKIETKLPLIREFEKNYDCILVGGRVANEAADQGIRFSEKVLLPQDYVSEGRLDIGPNTVAYFSQIIKTGKTIVWNGPMGKFEEKPYDIGTDAILHALLESDAFVVIGGGESLAIVEKQNVMNRIGFVSSGGGAMLEYLSGVSLPGLVALGE